MHSHCHPRVVLQHHLQRCQYGHGVQSTWRQVQARAGAAGAGVARRAAGAAGAVHRGTTGTTGTATTTATGTARTTDATGTAATPPTAARSPRSRRSSRHPLPPLWSTCLRQLLILWTCPLLPLLLLSLWTYRRQQSAKTACRPTCRRPQCCPPTHRAQGRSRAPRQCPCPCQCRSSPPQHRHRDKDHSGHRWAQER